MRSRCYLERHDAVDCPSKDAQFENRSSARHQTIACGAHCGTCRFPGLGHLRGYQALAMRIVSVARRTVVVGCEVEKYDSLDGD